MSVTGEQHKIQHWNEGICTYQSIPVLTLFLKEAIQMLLIMVTIPIEGEKIYTEKKGLY